MVRFARIDDPHKWMMNGRQVFGFYGGYALIEL